MQSFSVTKEASATAAHPGDTITYTITVTNTGQVPYTTADPASFRDDLSAVLDDATYNGDATSGASYAAPTLSWSGALDVGARVIITYSVTVDDPDTGDGFLDNAVVTPDGSGGTCPSGTSDPNCSASAPGQSYSVVKSASAASTRPGDKITYTVTVTNTGQVPYTADDPASFTDDLSGVIDDASYNDDATNGATYDRADAVLARCAGVGASVTITYSVTVDDPDTGDQCSATPSSRPPDPAELSERYGCRLCDQGARAELRRQQDLLGRDIAAGDDVTYTVRVTNTGQAPYTTADPASFTDDLSSVLDDATYNNDATNGATYSEPDPVLAGRTGRRADDHDHLFGDDRESRYRERGAGQRRGRPRTDRAVVAPPVRPIRPARPAWLCSRTPSPRPHPRRRRPPAMTSRTP